MAKGRPEGVELREGSPVLHLCPATGEEINVPGSFKEEGRRGEEQVPTLISTLLRELLGRGARATDAGETKGLNVPYVSALGRAI